VWGDEWICRMNWGWQGMVEWSRMVNRGRMRRRSKMMNRSRVVKWSSMMDRSSMVDRSRMVNWSRMMERSNRMNWSSMMDWSNWMNRCCMVNWCSVVSNMMNWSVMRIYMNRNRFSILVQFWFRIVRVLVWISIQFIQGNSLATVNLVPKLTSKLVLIKQGTIRADKPCTRGTISSIITHSVCLASRLRISVHSWAKWNGGAAKLCVRGFSKTGIVLARNSRDSMLIVVWVMMFLVIWVMMRLWWMIGCWFMVSWSWRMVRCRFMVDWSWRMVWLWLMVSWCWWNIRSRCWLMIYRSRRNIGSRSRDIWLRLMVGFGRRVGCRR